jgi:protease I
MGKSLQIEADEYDALLLPGGAINADTLRADKDVQRFVQSFDKENKPMAIICHAPWILISSNIVCGRTLTGYHTIEDDVRNAGGRWLDRESNSDGSPIRPQVPGIVKQLRAASKTKNPHRAGETA